MFSFKNKLNKIQLIKNKSNMFQKAQHWGPFYSYYFLGYYKNKSLLNLNILFFFCKKKNLIISALSEKRGVIATSFFSNAAYQIALKKKKVKNFYNVLFSKAYNFFTNFYEMVFKQKINLNKKYSTYSSYRRPSLIFFFKNIKSINLKNLKHYYSINRTRTIMIQSLCINQIYNGVGFCIYINDCLTLYFYYYSTYKLISKKKWRNLRFTNIRH